MINWQQLIITFYGFYAALGAATGFTQSRKHNTFGLTPFFILIGSFVWADAAIFGIFWSLVSLVCIFSNDWWLFILAQSLFWLTRSLGEMVYWLNQQFSPIKRVEPHASWLFHFFPNDSVWFVYQILWQCIATAAAIAAIFAARQWLNGV